MLILKEFIELEKDGIIIKNNDNIELTYKGCFFLYLSGLISFSVVFSLLKKIKGVKL